ncbi:hypothetical protein F5Y16DRAFT_353690 [Xylariaceae sp. FL0255]|nr:hypothetical protein F5Y16DRAFT_353690 [Xylariaceae sp. FL0255]
MANKRLITSLLALAIVSLQVNAHERPDASKTRPKVLKLEGLKNIIAFGDSYTDVGYNIVGYGGVQLPQPSLDNYEGNPPPPGTSTCYSPNYVEMLASEMNKTFTKLWDLAYSGAVVDGNLVSPYQYENNTFVYQVHGKFLPYFSEGRVPHDNTTAAMSKNKPVKREWEGSDTLFISLFGINDIDRAMGGYWPLDPLWEEKAPAMLTSWFDGLDKIREQGGEYFAILAVPPYWLSPSVQAYENATYTQLAQNRTLLWIEQLKLHHEAWTEAHPEIHAEIVDTFQLWLNITEEPERYPPLTQVTTDCLAYVGGYWPHEDLNWYNSSCAAPMKEYLWLDWLHPSWTVHEYMAKLIIKTMGL